MIQTFYMTIKIWIEHQLVTLNKKSNAQFQLNLTLEVIRFIICVLCLCVT